MLELSLDWAIVLVVVLIITLFVTMFIMYGLRGQTETRRRLELRKSLSQMLKRRAELAPPPKKLDAALKRVVRSIERAASSKQRVVQVRLDPNIELKAVAPDLLILRAPTAEGWATLHKSFDKIRIKRIKKTARGYEIRISSTLGRGASPRRAPTYSSYPA
jgi:hypothetical protein